MSFKHSVIILQQVKKDAASTVLVLLEAEKACGVPAIPLKLYRTENGYGGGCIKNVLLNSFKKVF